MTNENTPLQIRFDRVKCLVGTTETGRDEPYVLFAVCDLAGTPNGVMVRITDTFSMDVGETRRQGGGVGLNRRPLALLWPLSGTGAAPIADPDDVAVFIALIESDGGPELAYAVRVAVQAILTDKVLSGADVATLPSQIRKAIRLASDAGAPVGKDRLVGLRRLGLSDSVLRKARTGGFATHLDLTGTKESVEKGLTSETGSYRVYLRIERS